MKNRAKSLKRAVVDSLNAILRIGTSKKKARDEENRKAREKARAAGKSEDEIKKVMELPLRDFKVAYPQLPITAKNTIISIFASQIENGTFEQYNKAKYIDEVSGTRFDLTM